MQTRKIHMSLDEMDYYRYYCSNLISLEEFQVIKVGGIEIKAVITPGHARGSACFEIGKIFFSGDTVFMKDVAAVVEMVLLQAGCMIVSRKLRSVYLNPIYYIQHIPLERC